MSQPLSVIVSVGWLEREGNCKAHKMTLQNPKPSDFAALKNFSFDYGVYGLGE